REPWFIIDVGLRPASRTTAFWEGRTVDRLIYRGNISGGRDLPVLYAEVDVDPETGLILHSATWTVFPQFAAKFPEGVLTGEKTYFYEPRLTGDAPFWDVERLKAEVR
ncbi:MAG: hypothetical protein H7Y38_00890, partial [Armatimonadetes bacterium]|nr:hypothetical protein [Armatimonadota bacterium]